jgi:UDP-N-acetylmuramyl tripeptide synthase
MSLFVNENPILGDGTTIRSAAALGDFKPQFEEYIAVVNLVAASATSQDFFIAAPGQNYQVTGVTVTFGVTSTSGTVDIKKCTGTQAATAGTSVLTGTISLSGTANTPVQGTLSSTTANIQLTGGPVSAPVFDRLALVLAGTLTGLVDCLVQVRLKRI